MDLVKVWPDLAEFEFGEKRRPVGSVGLVFSCEDPPTDLPVSVLEHEDTPPTVANVSVELDGF